MILSNCTNGAAGSGTAFRPHMEKVYIPDSGKSPEPFTDGCFVSSETAEFSDLRTANRPSNRKISVEHMKTWCYPVAGRILPAECIRQHPHSGHNRISVFHTARTSSAIVRPV